MRHRKSGRTLQRNASHRKATLSALSVALIIHKKIRTTVAKAKETRMVVEKLITRAKRAVVKETSGSPKDVHARRISFSFLRDRDAVSSLYNDIAPKVATRPGGYTRVVKLGRRQGDGAELAVLELVDYNLGKEVSAPKKTGKAAAKTRRKKASPKSSKTPAPKEKSNKAAAPESAGESANVVAASEPESGKKA
jgi:large subunit ribosomal protein L17